MKTLTIRRSSARCRSGGFTLVELMVALTLGLLVAGAAVAALLAARLGFNSIDSSSQLRENVRFASSLMERITNEAGFVNVAYGFFPDKNQTTPPLRGYDNRKVNVTQGSATAPTFIAGAGINNGDVLVVTFFGASTVLASGLPGPADGSMINCAGIAEPQSTANPPVPATSIFHLVASASGEPTFACTYRDPASGNWFTVPLVSGVESMQMLYGTDGVVPGTAPPSLENPATSGADTVPDRYLRASELDIAGNLPATLDNWSRVRSIRVGLVLRGPPGSAVDRNATAQSYDVLGTGFYNANDVGSRLAVTTADGRLRQQVVYTIHLRNTQDPASLLR